MSVCRINNIAPGVTCTAVTSTGTVSLTNESEIDPDSIIECKADSLVWNTVPFKLQEPSGYGWIDSVYQFTMCVSKGSGRSLSVLVAPTATGFAAFIVDQGDYVSTAHWAEQVRNQNERGVNFTLDGGATVFRGLRSNTTTGGDWGMGGQDITSSAKLSVDKLQFVSNEPPKRDQVVTMGTESLRIDSVTDTPYAWSLSLANVNQ